MHPNPIYKHATDAENIAFARELGFGMLAIAHNGAPLLSHIPFLLSQDGKTIEFHLMRSNPVARACKDPELDTIHAKLAISGPHSYVSPDWYGTDNQVPTWNYVAVHLTGTLTAQPAASLLDLLDRQSAFFEDRLAPKPPWLSGKVAPQALQKMMRIISPFKMQIETVEGTWKLNQNKSDTVRNSAADHINAYGFGNDPRLLSAMMRTPPVAKSSVVKS